MEQVHLFNLIIVVYLSEKFLPLLKQNGKIVTVGSTAGLSTRVQTKELKQKFLNPNLTREELISLAKEFYEAVKDGIIIYNNYQVPMKAKDIKNQLMG